MGGATTSLTQFRPGFEATNRGELMSKRTIVVFLIAPAILALAAWVVGSAAQRGQAQRQKPASADKSAVKYQFARAVRADERPCDWYRTTHAEEAAARYGVSADEVGDGMDAWHWWVGVDNPEYWRQNTIAVSKAPGNLLGIKVDFLRL